MIRLVGAASNRSAIGAKVRVKATIDGKTFWQLREIPGGTGYGSQGDLRARFGLGNATRVEELRIEWPSGIVQELSNVSPRQILTITETLKLAPLAPGGFRIPCRKGACFEVQTSADLLNWTSLGMATNETGTLAFEDGAAAGGTGARFYRAVMVCLAAR